MADLTKNAISVTVRDRAKRTKIWDHNSYKIQITKFSKILNFIEKIRNGRLDQNAI